LFFVEGGCFFGDVVLVVVGGVEYCVFGWVVVVGDVVGVGCGEVYGFDVLVGGLVVY